MIEQKYRFASITVVVPIVMVPMMVPVPPLPFVSPIFVRVVVIAVTVVAVVIRSVLWVSGANVNAASRPTGGTGDRPRALRLYHPRRLGQHCCGRTPVERLYDDVRF